MTTPEIPNTGDEPVLRSGFACLVGRPNVGKSTLTNALVGTKVAITSNRPQTTRHPIRGILNRPDAQLIIVDTPGLHRPRNVLGQWLGDQVRTAVAEVDVVAVCVAVDEPLGAGDRYLMREVAQARPATVVAIATKTDLARPQQVAKALLDLQEAGAGAGLTWAEIVPCSAVTDSQVGLVADLLIKHLPEGPRLYPLGEVTDEPLEVQVAELVREAALEGVREELPHSLAVLVDEIIPREGRPEGKPLQEVYVSLYVERPSQKAIIIGTGGSRLKQVGIRARAGIEPLLGSKVYLNLQVKVAADWQRDPKLLRKLGFLR